MKTDVQDSVLEPGLDHLTRTSGIRPEAAVELDCMKRAASDPKRTSTNFSAISNFKAGNVIRQVSIDERLRWFSAEVIIIIVGILIALAIDKWRQEIENENIEHDTFSSSSSICALLRSR